MNAVEAAVRFGVIPVVEIDDPRHADALAETLLEAGLGVVEITFRTEAAVDVIARIADRHPDMLVGAGTVVGPHHLDRAQAAGAKFALAPGLSRRVVEHASACGLPYVPGIMTPSDIQAGIELGLSTFKFFPAEPAGGVAFLRTIAAPFALHGMRFIPTGGVSAASLLGWLREPAIAAVGGSWIASRRAIADGDWLGIGAKAREAVAIARSTREALS